MTKNEISVVYMGTPDFAVEPLKVMIDAGIHVKAVVTVADKPAGRGQQLRESPVKVFARYKGIPVLQPEKLRDEIFVETLRQLNADLFIVVAFRMLPEVIWEMPRLGTFNLHASLLPNYRGAAPINHAIINGETVTGVTTFFINHEIDSGSIIMQDSLPIGPDDTADTLHDQLMVAGASLVLKTVRAISDNHIQPVEQIVGNTAELSIKPAPKIFKNDCRINWFQSAKKINDFIRGLSSYPGAFTDILHPDHENATLKIYKAKIVQTRDEVPGNLVTDGKSYIRVCCIDGCIELIDLQLSGKKRMSVGELLRGLRNPQLLKLA
jgi:methionyl-tRNA formyltransferase